MKSTVRIRQPMAVKPRRYGTSMQYMPSALIRCEHCLVGCVISLRRVGYEFNQRPDPMKLDA